MVGSMFIRRTQTGGGRRTESLATSLIASCTPNASAAACASAPSSTSVATSIPRRPQADWPLLCARINDALSGQAPLVADCPPAVEEEAQRIAAQLIARGAAAPTAGPTDVQPVDVDSLRLVRPRSVGVEQVGRLWALEQLDLPALLTRLGVNGALRSAATGAIVGRLAAPASERATHRRWLQASAAVSGSCSASDFETVGAMNALPRLGRAGEASRAASIRDRGASVRPRDGAASRPAADGDALRPDQHLLPRVRGERPAAGATRAHSKEKRSDCPLLTLGLMLDASGFVRRSKVFAGNVREHRTLAGMLEALRGAGRRPGGDGPRCRHRRLCDLVARQRLPLSGESAANATAASMPMPRVSLQTQSPTRPCTCTRWSRPTPTKCACTATPGASGP